MRLAIGVVIGVHGVRGELKVRPLTDDAEQLETVRSAWFDDEPEPRKIRAIRFHAGNALIKLAGIDNPEDAARFRGMTLRVPAGQLRPLDENEYFLYQVIGLEVRTENGDLLGKIVDLIETGATDVLVIDPVEKGPQVLLPALPDVVLEIDPAAGKVIVRPLEYLD